jgi:zinc transport system substrate-binding protein
LSFSMTGSEMAKKILALGLMIAACSLPGPGSRLETSPKIKIVASVFPLLEFARNVAGEDGDVSLLLPPGAGVHTWQPRASDIIRLSSADLFIYVGAGLEPWIDDVLQSISSTKLHILVAAEALTLEQREESGRREVDPHIWLDFEKDLVILDHIARAVAQIDPANAQAYSTRAARYGGELKRMDERFRAGLSRCRQRTFLLGGHAAFGYLAERYGLKQVSISGMNPDAEPSPGQVVEAIELARKSNLKAVFMEANTNPKMSRILARELSAELLVLHPE